MQELITFVKTKITIFCTKTKLNGMNVRYFNNTQGHTMHTDYVIFIEIEPMNYTKRKMY